MVAAKQCVVRQGVELSSQVVGLLRNGEFVTIDGCVDRRGHLTAPIRGWASCMTAEKYTCLVDEASVFLCGHAAGPAANGRGQVAPSIDAAVNCDELAISKQADDLARKLHSLAYNALLRCNH